MSALTSSPLSVVPVWYQFQCVSKVLSACIGHVQTISAVPMSPRLPSSDDTTVAGGERAVFERSQLASVR
eukprot:2167609-Prymnesium_polylepis.2